MWSVLSEHKDMTGNIEPDDIASRSAYIYSRDWRVSVHDATCSQDLPGVLPPFVPLSSFLHLPEYTSSTERGLYSVRRPTMPISVPLTRYRKSDLPEGHPHRTEDYADLAPDTWDEPDYRRNPHTHPNIATHYGLEEVRPPHPDLKQPRRAQYTYPAHSYTLVSPPPRPLLHCAVSR